MAVVLCLEVTISLIQIGMPQVDRLQRFQPSQATKFILFDQLAIEQLRRHEARQRLATNALDLPLELRVGDFTSKRQTALTIGIRQEKPSTPHTRISGVSVEHLIERRDRPLVRPLPLQHIAQKEEGVRELRRVRREHVRIVEHDAQRFLRQVELIGPHRHVTLRHGHEHPDSVERLGETTIAILVYFHGAIQVSGGLMKLADTEKRSWNQSVGGPFN